ncbi:cation:proton antiporter [Clostridium sp. MSJ-11]|uniref:Cation:proton antiporter n=1 Tax=Clostridium mobile TaxID=2841512 RepID=A0ABS6ECE3_9CLOT|nr:monovalent cation/H+ antiporter complex subunit F [Clostridium mobile]MBU5482853.1 cation:proton antiporter [Clostridium mobile]
MSKVLIFSVIFLSITILGCLYRGVKGPTSADRLIAINVISTKTIIIIASISFILKETYFIDVALVYALISFIASIIISRYIESLGGDNDD